jgi:hypothetical protein
MPEDLCQEAIFGHVLGVSRHVRRDRVFQSDDVAARDFRYHPPTIRIFRRLARKLPRHSQY